MSEIPERTLSWEEEEAALEAQVAEEAAAELALLEAIKAKQEALKTKQDALAKRKADVEAKKQAELAEAEAKKQAELDAVRQKADEFINQATDTLVTIGESIVYFVYPVNPTNGDIKSFCDGILTYINGLYSNLDQPMEAVVRPKEVVVRPVEAVVRPKEVVVQSVEVLDHQKTFASIAAASIAADEPDAPQAPKLPTNIGFTEVKPKSKTKSKTKSWDLTLEQIEEKRKHDFRFRTLPCENLFNGVGKGCKHAAECHFAHSDEQMPKAKEDLTLVEIEEKRKQDLRFRIVACKHLFNGGGRCPRAADCPFAHSDEQMPKAKEDLTLEQIEAKRTQNSRFRTLQCENLFNGDGRCPRAAECLFAHSDEQMPKVEEDLTVAEIMEHRKINSNFRSKWCDNYYRKNGCNLGRDCRFAHKILVNLDGSVE
jgi:hypothetical protein